jgi:argininosuccinate lyase
VTHVDTNLQWGGRFTAPPDPELLAFGSSLEDDLVLAPFDVRCSLGHVAALAGGGLLAPDDAAALRDALAQVQRDVADGGFAAYARAGTFEDVHGAIDARVRELAPARAGEALHTGRSRNDQVATTLLLYARDRASLGAVQCAKIACTALDIAEGNEHAVFAGTTHWQPAQPILLGFWSDAVARMFLRAAARFEDVFADTSRYCPLGSAALAGSTLPLDRAAAARYLGFAEPSPNALDAVGDRDVVLDLVHAVARAQIAASRPSEELVIWATPAFGYAKIGDPATTGSSLMPQKRNPDYFELVRGAAGDAIGTLAGALGSASGIGLSYHRDLQETKRVALRGIERGLAVLAIFERALSYVRWDTARMAAHAENGFTTATDVADALIANGVTARRAHALVGEGIRAVQDARDAFAPEDLAAFRTASGIELSSLPLEASASLAAKVTAGSTGYAQVADMRAATRAAAEAVMERNA